MMSTLQFGHHDHAGLDFIVGPIPSLPPDLTFCPTCGRGERSHVLLNSGQKMCEMRNGHLMNMVRLFQRVKPEGGRTYQALVLEIERRNHEGWHDGKPTPRITLD